MKAYFILSKTDSDSGQNYALRFTLTPTSTPQPRCLVSGSGKCSGSRAFKVTATMDFSAHIQVYRGLCQGCGVGVGVAVDRSR